MIRVVHYLTGYFCPARSGIEVAVNNFMQMTAGQTQNYVFTKNAIAKYPNGMRALRLPVESIAIMTPALMSDYGP